jgi:hypothetical protein
MPGTSMSVYGSRSPDGRWWWDGQRWVSLAPPPPPPPPTAVGDGPPLPGGPAHWDGRRWSSVPTIPWELTGARLLLFVEAGVVGLYTVPVAFALGVLSVLVVLFNPEHAEALTGWVLLAFALFGVALGAIVGLLITLGVKLPRRRWAHRVAAGLQVVVGVYATLVIVVPGPSRSGAGAALVVLAFIGVALALLLAPATRRAVASQSTTAAPR